MAPAVDISRRQRPVGPGPGVAGATHRRERIAYLDRLKLTLVAIIIAGHGAVAYGDLENAWPYQDVQEVRRRATTPQPARGARAHHGPRRRTGSGA